MPASRFLILSAIILLNSLESSAQPIHKNGSIKTYFQLTNQAELYITEGKYDLAIHAYKKATKYKNPFAYDAYNAVLCACILQKPKSGHYFVDVLLKKGIPPAFFQQQKLKTLYAYAQKNARYKDRSIDFQLRNRIDSLLAMDQRYRSDDVRFRDSLYRIDSLMHIEIASIFATYGYPGEEKIGLWMTNDTTFYLKTPFDILLIHAMKWDNRTFVPAFEKFVLAGDMHPLKFVVLSPMIDWSDRYQYGCTGNGQIVFAQVEDEVYTCNDDQEKALDLNRSKTYLEPIADLKKRLFSIKRTADLN